MQLASSVAVGLAMFLLAILLPVFLVAWKREEGVGGKILDYIADDSTCVPYTVEAHPRHSKKKTYQGLGEGIGMLMGLCFL